MIGASDWTSEWELLHQLLSPMGFYPPDDLKNRGDFIRWLRRQQIVIERDDPRLAFWPEMIDRLDQAGILRAPDNWMPDAMRKRADAPLTNLDPQLNTRAVGAACAAFGARLFARPEAAWNALDALRRLYADGKGRPVQVGFNPATGLARTLVAESFTREAASSRDAMFERADWFLKSYGGLLNGEAEEGDRQATRWTRSSAVGNVVIMQQVDANNIPVYGATAAFSFDDAGWLTFIQNGWYPLPDFEKDEPFEWNWEKAQQRAIDFLKRGNALAQDAEVEATFGRGSQEGRLRLPTLAKKGMGNGQNDLFPLAWSVLVVDHTNGSAWEVLLDDKTGSVFHPHWRSIANEEPQPDLLEISSHAPLWVPAYRDNAAALGDKLALKTWAQTGSPPQGWAPATLQSPVDALPDSAAIDFPMDGPAFDQPIPGVPLTLKALRSGHVYHHLREAARTFDQIRTAAWPAPIAPPPGVPGIDLQLTVFMDSSGTSKYLPASGAGNAPSGELRLRPGGAHDEIDDQVLDCEVLYHEYTHAMLHQTRREVVENGGSGFLQSNFRAALNEGLAMYFGVALAERISPGVAQLRWGEYAYAAHWWQEDEPWYLEHTDPSKQRAGWDFLPVYNLYPQLPTFHGASSHHLCGMLFARALWDVRGVLGSEACDALVLRAISMLGGVPDGMTPPAEVILHRARELYGESHENALRLIMLSRNIVAQSPVHALLRFNLGSHTYTLAAAARGSNGSGCFYVTESDLQWQSLGQGGPHEIVALAAVEVVTDPAGAGPRAVLLFAAGDRWSPLEGGAIAANSLYWCALDPNNFNPAITWQPLAWPLSNVTGVFSLAAAARPGASGDAFSLFAATAQGAFQFDGRWQAGEVVGKPWSQISDDLILDLVVFADEHNALQLALAGRLGASVIGLDTLARNSAFDHGTRPPWVLCIAAADDGHVWIGTASDGIHHFDPQTGQWSRQGGDLPPVLSLLLLDGAGAQRMVLAGASGGVYVSTGSQWERLTHENHGNPTGITTRLGQAPNGDLLAVNEGHGLQRLLLGVLPSVDVFPFSDGLPHAGALIDVAVPPHCHQFASTLALPALQPGDVATYVIYVPDATCQHLQLQAFPDPIAMEVYFIAPHISLDENLRAGVRPCTLVAPASGIGYVMMNQVIEAGYYLVVLRSGDTIPASTFDVLLG